MSFFPQISAGEPDPLGHQKVFLWPGRAAAPVSWLCVSLIVSKSPSCKLSRVNHTEKQRLFVRAVHSDCLLPFLSFDVESTKNFAISIFTCVPDCIDHRVGWRGLCVWMCSRVQQLHLILIRVFSQPLPELKAAQSWASLD